jgi:hypothetical protein
MYAYAKGQVHFFGGFGPSAHNVFLGTQPGGIPVLLVFAVVQIKIVVVVGHGHKIAGTGLFVQRYQFFRLPGFSLPLPYHFFKTHR